MTSNNKTYIPLAERDLHLFQIEQEIKSRKKITVYKLEEEINALKEKQNQFNKIIQDKNKLPMKMDQELFKGDDDDMKAKGTMASKGGYKGGPKSSPSSLMQKYFLLRSRQSSSQIYWQH